MLLAKTPSIPLRLHRRIFSGWRGSCSSVARAILKRPSASCDERSFRARNGARPGRAAQSFAKNLRGGGRAGFASVCGAGEIVVELALRFLDGLRRILGQRLDVAECLELLDRFPSRRRRRASCRADASHRGRARHPTSARVAIFRRLGERGDERLAVHVGANGQAERASATWGGDIEDGGAVDALVFFFRPGGRATRRCRSGGARPRDRRAPSGSPRARRVVGMKAVVRHQQHGRVGPGPSP